MPARPSASITVAAILAIAGSALALISIFFAALGMAMMRSAASVPALPPAVQAVTTVSLLLFAGLAVFGIFTGVGLLRLKNWARISILVFSGLATAVSSLTIIFATFLPIPAAPEAGPAMGAFIKVFIMIFYGIPLGIGIWWVILFTRKKISDQFQPQAPGSSGDPNAPLAMPAGTATALPPPVAPSTPACPLPIMVVGGLWILSSLSLVFVLYARTPMVLFGHPFNRSLSVTLWVLKSILYVVAGVGLFRVKPLESFAFPRIADLREPQRHRHHVESAL